MKSWRFKERRVVSCSFWVRYTCLSFMLLALSLTCSLALDTWCVCVAEKRLEAAQTRRGYGPILLHV